MIKQILAIGSFAAAGVAVAALVDEDFREDLIGAGRSIKDAFCQKKTVDAEEDEECEAPSSDNGIGPGSNYDPNDPYGHIWDDSDSNSEETTDKFSPVDAVNGEMPDNDFKDIEKKFNLDVEEAPDHVENAPKSVEEESTHDNISTDEKSTDIEETKDHFDLK